MRFRLPPSLPAILGVLFVLALSASLLQAVDPVRTGRGNVAAGGYDPVAYFTDAGPTRGEKTITHEWNGAVWRFASAENRDRFAADPEKYAPQYGGYCAYAVSQGYTAGIDPEAWAIHDGKLYLNYNRRIRSKWSQDVPGYVTAGDENWPKILAE